jgi:hypothetical protein
MGAENFRRYLNEVPLSLTKYLLPGVRRDIKKNKRLSYHFYVALRKGFFKPASWFRGILFPLCTDPTVTIREAELIASIIVKVERVSVLEVHPLGTLQHLHTQANTNAVHWGCQHTSQLVDQEEVRFAEERSVVCVRLADEL